MIAQIFKCEVNFAFGLSFDLRGDLHSRLEPA